MSAGRATPITVLSSTSASRSGESLCAARVRAASLSVSSTVFIRGPLEILRPSGRRGIALRAARVCVRSPRVSWCFVAFDSIDLLRQLFRLVLLVQGGRQLVEVAVHDLVELVEGEVDAMIGDAPLREIIGADALGAVSGSDLELARLRLLTLLPRS